LGQHRRQGAVIHATLHSPLSVSQVKRKEKKRKEKKRKEKKRKEKKRKEKKRKEKKIVQQI